MNPSSSLVVITAVAALLSAKGAATDSAPTADRVQFPKGYASDFEILRTVFRKEKLQVVTIYGNRVASSVTNMAQLPYPFGSIIVMETAEAPKTAEVQEKLTFDEKGFPRKGKVLGLHVMRRERDFGKDYGLNRTGEWEYVEYRSDGTYITPPEKSFSCAACHVKAGADRDFVYRGRIAP